MADGKNTRRGRLWPYPGLGYAASRINDGKNPLLEADPF
jgi:hypothetical protein